MAKTEQKRMVTARQKKVIDIILENQNSGQVMTLGEILLKAGYSKSISERPQSVFESLNFKEYLNTIDDRPIIKKWMQWALSDKDRRVALEAGREILKLKDRYPDVRTKVVGLFANIGELTGDGEDEKADSPGL